MNVAKGNEKGELVRLSFLFALEYKSIQSQFVGGGVLFGGRESCNCAITIPRRKLNVSLFIFVSMKVVNWREPGEYDVVTENGVVDILPVVDVVAVIVVGSGEGHTGMVSVIEGHHHIV